MALFCACVRTLIKKLSIMEVYHPVEGSTEGFWALGGPDSDGEALRELTLLPYKGRQMQTSHFCLEKLEV